MNSPHTETVTVPGCGHLPSGQPRTGGPDDPRDDRARNTHGAAYRLHARRRRGGPLAELSPRERDILPEMAEGESNQGIAEALVISEAPVEKHVRSIFRKLEIGPSVTEHRRVLAVLQYVQAAQS